MFCGMPTAGLSVSRCGDQYWRFSTEAFQVRIIRLPSLMIMLWLPGKCDLFHTVASQYCRSSIAASMFCVTASSDDIALRHRKTGVSVKSCRVCELRTNRCILLGSNVAGTYRIRLLTIVPRYVGSEHLVIVVHTG